MQNNFEISAADEKLLVTKYTLLSVKTSVVQSVCTKKNRNGSQTKKRISNSEKLLYFIVKFS